MKRTRQIRAGNRKGFTLVEMIVVVAMIGLIMAITLPNFAGFLRRERIMGLRSQLVSDLYYARSLAIANRRTFAVEFQPGEYRIVDTSDGSVERTIEAPRGVEFEAGANANFYAWGLADAVNITLRGSHETTVVSVMPTGAVDHE
jgi:prepilin-type N-terminal cleavage/methylation domain-containing protein